MNAKIEHASSNRLKKSGVKYILRLILQLLSMALAFFIAAGDLSIKRAWIYFGIGAVAYIISSLVLMKYNPELLKVIEIIKESMIRLDHFVLNIDNNMEKLMRLKKQIAPLGYPFEPTWGKGTKGFKVANLWIGLQYLEMVWLKTKDGGGWRPDWVKKYNEGHRGIIAIYLLTDKLDEIKDELKNRGVPVSEPERVSFRWFFGLLKKTMPWRSIFTDPIPGTDLQICYGELDSPDIMEKMKAYMVPNAADNGIEGIREATIRSNFSKDAWTYIQKLFPEATLNGSRLTYDMGTTYLSFESCENLGLNVELNAVTANSKYRGKSFELENLKIIM